MRIFALVIAAAGLILTIIPSLFVFLGDLTWQAHALLMFIGMLLWFIFAPFGMRSRKPGVENREE